MPLDSLKVNASLGNLAGKIRRAQNHSKVNKITVASLARFMYSRFKKVHAIKPSYLEKRHDARHNRLRVNARRV